MASVVEPGSKYVPILKGRAGELRALREMHESTASHLTPLIEVPLTASDIDSDDPETINVSANVPKFARDLIKSWANFRRIIVDTSIVPPRSGSVPIVELIDLLGQENFYSFTPVVRPSDPSWAIERISQSIQEWQLNSACIRLAGDDLDDSETALPVALDGLMQRLSLSPADVDLVLDLGHLADERATTFAARIARLVIGEIPHINDWRTLVCASGAFPPDLNSAQPEVLTEFPRYDAAMWNSVQTRVRGRVPAFGDYAVAYPGQSVGAPFAPAPQLRFTADNNWLVMKGRKQDRRGARQFYDICARIAGSGYVDPDLSWGDSYVNRAAQAAQEESTSVGTGNAMIWRAIGTSHHLAYVANRLATLGVP